MKRSSTLLSRLSLFALPFLGGISGLASMGLQIVWQRYSRYGIGGDTASATITLAASLVGIGVGAWWAGRISIKRLAITSACIHLLLGVMATMSIRHAELTSGISASLATLLHISYADQLTISTGTSIAVVGIAMLAVGASMALLYRIAQEIGGSKWATIHYGSSVAGSAAAVYIMTYHTLRIYLLSWHILVCALLSLGVALLCLGYQRLLRTSSEDMAHEMHPRTARSIPWSWVALACWSGGSSAFFETVAIRVYGPAWPSSAFHYPWIVLTFLTGYALGSYTTAIVDRLRIAPRIIISGATALGGISLLWMLWYRSIFVPSDVTTTLGLYMIACLPYAFFHGMVFPLILSHPDTRQGRESGRIPSLFFAANALGTLMALIAYQGALLTIGSRVPILVGIGVSLGIAAWSIAPKPHGMLRWILTASMILIGVSIGNHMLPWSIIVGGTSRDHAMIREGISGVSRIDWDASHTAGPVVVDGQYMSYIPRHPRHTLLMSYALLHDPRERLLVLGLGGGGMVSDLVADPKIRQIDVVEWSRELIALIGTDEAKRSTGLDLTDPRLRMYPSDARMVVRTIPEDAYDVIIDNLAVVDWAGSTGIKSTQFMQEIHRILRPGGIFILETNHSDKATYEAVMATLTRTFPSVVTHYGDIAIASDRSIRQIPEDILRTVYDRYASQIGITIDPMVWYQTGWTTQTREMYRSVLPIDDDRVMFEYRR